MKGFVKADMRVVIMAGGKGTRIAEQFPDLPKPMVPVLGKPILQHQIECAAAQGFVDFTLIVGYLSDTIVNFFGDGQKFGVRIEYVREDVPLGTGGALSRFFDEDILLLFGDVYFHVDLRRFIAFHQERKAIVSLFAHPNSHPADSDILVCESDGRVTEWVSKSVPRLADLRNLVNAGLYILSADALPEGEPVRRDLDKELIMPLVQSGGVYAYRSSEYVKDMGTLERLDSVTRDVEAGVCAARMLSRPQRAIFLDRDGVLNEYCGFIHTPEQVKLTEGAAEAVAMINASPFLAICVTNQPVIARGEVTLEMLDRIHGRMDMLLAEHGAFLDDLFFCPHHPDCGFPGEAVKYKIECNCRKPKSGLLLQAAECYNIDLKASYMIGDMTADIAAGAMAGCKTIGVRTGCGLMDGKYEAKPDYMAETIADAVRSAAMEQ